MVRTTKAKAPRKKADLIQIRIKKRVSPMPREHKAGTLFDVDEFQEAYPQYAENNIDATWAFNTKNSEIFQLVVNGKDVNNMTKKAKIKKAASSLRFGGNQVTIEDDGTTAVCRGERYDIDELESWLGDVESALDSAVSPESDNRGRAISLSNSITVGCCVGTVEEIRAIVDAAFELRD